MRQAERAGVSLTTWCYNSLMMQLQVEGRTEELGAVVKAMEVADVPFDDYTHYTLEEVSLDDLSRMRRAQLLRLLERNLPSAITAAWALFDGLLERGLADEHQLNVMLTRACDGSAEQRELNARCEETGMALTAMAFNPLLATLQVEGCADELDAILNEMDERGVERNERTERALELATATEQISRMRTSKLTKLLRMGQHEAAWALYAQLLERGAADSHNVATMSMHACDTGAARRALLTEAEAKGVTLSARCYHSLMSQLQLEGREDEMAAVAEKMAEKGLKEAEQRRRIDTKTEDSQGLARMRGAELVRLLRNRKLDAAWALFDGLLERRLADSLHLQLMLRHACGGDGAKRRDLSQRATEAGVAGAGAPRSYGRDARRRD